MYPCRAANTQKHKAGLFSVEITAGQDAFDGRVTKLSPIKNPQIPTENHNTLSPSTAAKVKNKLEHICNIYITALHTVCHPLNYNNQLQ